MSRLRVFMRFQSEEEHTALVEGLLKARKLVKQIQLCQHYKSIGIRSPEEARLYEADRKKQEAARSRRESGPQPNGSGSSKRGLSRLSAGDSASGSTLELLPENATKRKRGRSSQAAVVAVADDNEDGQSSAMSAAANAAAAAPGNGRELSSKEKALCQKVSLSHNKYREIRLAIR